MNPSQQVMEQGTSQQVPHFLLFIIIIIVILVHSKVYKEGRNFVSPVNAHNAESLVNFLV